MLKLTTKKNGIAEDDIAEKLLLFKRKYIVSFF